MPGAPHALNSSVAAPHSFQLQQSLARDTIQTCEGLSRAAFLHGNGVAMLGMRSRARRRTRRHERAARLTAPHVCKQLHAVGCHKHDGCPKHVRQFLAMRIQNHSPHFWCLWLWRPVVMSLAIRMAAWRQV